MKSTSQFVCPIRKGSGLLGSEIPSYIRHRWCNIANEFAIYPLVFLSLASFVRVGLEKVYMLMTLTVRSYRPGSSSPHQRKIRVLYSHKIIAPPFPTSLRTSHLSSFNDVGALFPQLDRNHPELYRLLHVATWRKFFLRKSVELSGGNFRTRYRLIGHRRRVGNADNRWTLLHDQRRQSNLPASRTSRQIATLLRTL